jgi:uncharacterized protein YkwD
MNPRRPRSTPLLLALTVACGDTGSGEEGSTGATESASDPSASDPSASDPSASDPSASDPSASDPSASDPTATDPSASDTDPDSTGGDPNDADAMCERWLADRADMTEGVWTGDLASCDPGDIDEAGRTNALRILNLYRWLADLPPITHDATLDTKGQSCALMMTANGTLSHTPPPEWTCYAAEGAEAAGSSNIATGPAVASIDLYMMDPGNPTTIGHRRWILSNSIGPTGIGSTDSYSCLWTLGGTGAVGAPWIAYPPPGPFPLAATTIGFTTLDETGWSLQSDTIDLSAASVEVTKDGMVLPMTITVLGGGYGSSFGISMIPDGWQVGVGAYHVTVSGTSEPIEYDVEIVDCGVG